MSLRATRRGVLIVAAGTIGLGAAGTAAGQETGTCAGFADVEDGWDDDSGGDALREGFTTLQYEIMAAHADAQPASGFSPKDRERALETGLSAREGVVVFEGRSDETCVSGTGTGWLVEGGYVVTNAHNVDHDVAGRQTEMLCHRLDGTTLEVEVVDYVRERPPGPDVAVLATDHDGPGLPLGSTGTLSEGQPLVQVGHPGGFGFWTITLGAFRGLENDELLSSVPGLEGASGSPVMTLDGEVVGMLSGSTPENPLGDATGEAAPTGEGPPSVTDAPVQQGLLVEGSVSLHVAVETVAGKLEEWT